MKRGLKISHPEWLKHSDPGKTLRLFREGKLPDSIAGWMLIVSLKHPLRAIYGSDLRAAWHLLISAVTDIIKRRWIDFRFAHGLLTTDEREVKAEMESEEPAQVTNNIVTEFGPQIPMEDVEISGGTSEPQSSKSNKFVLDEIRKVAGQANESLPSSPATADHNLGIIRKIMHMCRR